MLFSTIPAPCFMYIWQKQQNQMQEVLRRLSQQQNGQSKETQQSPRRLLSSEPSEHSTLIQKHKQVVAEKDAKIKELMEEIHQLSVKVKKRSKCHIELYILARSSESFNWKIMSVQTFD